MDQKEKLFFDKLKDIFMGVKIKGESGFINLMRIKSSYFDIVLEKLIKDVDTKTKEFPDFKEELFDKLYNFFKTYFSESGSIYFSYTPLKSKIYERVYTNQKDVALFWKTHMLYYVKTDRLWNDLSIDYNDDGVSCKIHFDVSSLKHKKSNVKKEVIYELKEIIGREIVFNVLYSERGKKTRVGEILKVLRKNGIILDEEKLSRIFRIFEKQNEVDFFINKNAEHFLKEQFDLWLKNYLFDDKSDFSDKRLKELKTLKEIAYMIIDFVAQFEDELVKIWNKPKFVLNSNYVITLDKIVKKNGLKIIEKIVEHEGFADQVREWKELGIVKRFDKQQLFATILKGKECEKLPIDTRYFDEDIKLEILSLFDNLDEELDGWLIHSENYQALKTILPKFKERIQTIYIDPPFNLGRKADFLYTVNYKDANWITLLENRLNLAWDLLNEKGSIFVRCDYNGNMFVRLLLNDIFGEENFRNEIFVKRITKVGFMKESSRQYSPSVDSVFWFSKILNKFTFYPQYVTLDKKKEPYWKFMESGGRSTTPVTINGRTFYPRADHNWKFSQEKINKLSKEGRIRINEKASYIDFKGNKTKGRPEYLVIPTEKLGLDNLWTDIPGYSFGWGFKTENSEQLLSRIIRSTSDKNDLILDFFLGSGTTTAVAHKLGRKWVGIEMGDHFFSVVLPRMKNVLAYDKSGISKEIEEYNGGGFFKYYDLEQYEQTLKRVKYKESDPFIVFSDKTIYQQYVFLKDLKFLESVKLDYESNRVKIDFSKIYLNIDLAETLSCITGKEIKKIERRAVILENGDKIFFDDIDFNIIRPLIWW